MHIVYEILSEIVLPTVSGAQIDVIVTVSVTGKDYLGVVRRPNGRDCLTTTIITHR